MAFDPTKLVTFKGTSINSNAKRIPESILNRRKNYEQYLDSIQQRRQDLAGLRDVIDYEKNRRLNVLPQIREEYVNLSKAPTLNEFNDATFAHGVKIFSSNARDDGVQSSIDNIKNIMANGADSSFSISASRPGEELGGIGVYVKGNVKMPFLYDVYSLPGGAHELYGAYASYDDFQTLSKVNSNDIIPTVLENNMSKDLLNRHVPTDIYNHAIENNSNPRTFFNTPSAYKEYTETILTNPQIQGMWYDPNLLKQEDIDQLLKFSKENNIPIRQVNSIAMTDEIIDTQRILNDPFNTQYYESIHKGVYDAYLNEGVKNPYVSTDEYINKIKGYEGETLLQKERNYLKQASSYSSPEEIVAKYQKLGMQEDTQAYAASLMGKYKAGELTQDEVRAAMTNNASLIENYQNELNAMKNLSPDEKVQANIISNRRIANNQEYAQSIISRRPEPTNMRSITEAAIERGTAKRRLMRQEAAQESANNILSRYETIQANNAVNKNEIVQDAIARGRAKRIEQIGSKRVQLEDIAKKHGVSLSELERNGYLDLSGNIPSFQLDEEIAAGGKGGRRGLIDRFKSLRERFKNRNKKVNLPSRELLEESKKDISTDTSKPIPQYKNPEEEVGPKPISNRERQRQINQERQNTKKKGESRREKRERIKNNKERRQRKLEQSQQKPVTKNNPYYANDGKIEDETVGIRKLDEAINGRRVIVTGADRPDIMNSKPDSQKIRTNVFNNEDGTSSKFIQIGDSSTIRVDTDADGNIIRKMYGTHENGSVTNGYAINYDKDGNVVKEGFRQNSKWTNVVEYDKDLKPIGTFTDPDLNIDEAKALKEEADKAWKRFGYEGISDILPDFYYKQKPEPKPEPKSAEDIFNDKLEEIEKLYNEGKLSDDEYADALNKLYNKEQQTKKPETKPKITPRENAYDSPLATAPPRDSYELQMNKYDYYANEYEKMKDFVDNYDPTGKDAEALAKDAKKIEDFFGKDKYSAEDARLKYEEAKLYGRHRDDPDDPLRRGSKAWWDKRDELMKQRRALNKNRQEFINSEKAAKELEDSKFIREVAMNRDIRDMLETGSPTYLSDPDVAKTIQESVNWLKDEDNINRYESIPQEFRDKIEGDIKREKFEMNKERRNYKLDADYENFKSEYEKLTSSQKDEQEKLRLLESKYKEWQRINKKGSGQKDPAILDDIKKSKEKISGLKKEIKEAKKNMKRTSRKTRDRASNIKEEIKNIKNQLDDNEMYKAIQEAYQNEVKANPSLTFKQYLKDNYKNTRFENFKAKESYEIERLKNDLQFHKDLLKEQSGIDIAKEEGDIVERVFGKLKKASKVDLAMSGIAAIGKYKDSRKEGRGVLSSTTRAGVDFAASQLMGPALYMGLTAARVAPKLAVSGAMYLQNEVRQMNTASRFRVFGDASFQDNDNLATMRQSGMELAKMSNYNLEQTLMGNEARYLHR